MKIKETQRHQYIIEVHVGELEIIKHAMFRWQLENKVVEQSYQISMNKMIEEIEKI